MVVVAVLGLALAVLSGLRPLLGHAARLHAPGDACLKVQTSVYSKIAGVPVALIGLIGYIGIFVSLLVPDRDEVRLATLVMTVIGVCFSGYLTYRELFTLKTICEECAASAVLMLLLFLAATTRYVLGDPPASARRPRPRRRPPARASAPRPRSSPRIRSRARPRRP